MGYKEIYNEWLTNAYLMQIQKQNWSVSHQMRTRSRAFYTDLEFGTAGLRGIIGAGTNRMNIYTVRRQHRDWQTIF